MKQSPLIVSQFILLLAAVISTCTSGFAPALSFHRSNSVVRFESEGSDDPAADESARPDFEFSFDMPSKGIAEYGIAEVQLTPVMEKSEIIVVRYALPFGLNAAPDPAMGQVVVTKDGEGGEKVGDILRQTTIWRGTTPGIFDVSKNADNFELVIQALVTNDLSVSDEIVLVFERPL